MPFTEDDLRAVLAERSEAAPAPTDLAASIETRGRTVRRRRRTAGALLTAAAVAAALLVPGALRGPENKPTASRSVDVDVALVRGASPAAKYVNFRTPQEMAGQSEVIAIGRVEGYSWGPGTSPPGNGVGLKTVVMRVRVERGLKGTGGGAGGGRIYLSMFGGDRYSPEVYRRAIPPGARLIAFTGPTARLEAPGAARTTNRLLGPLFQGVIVEDAEPSGTRLVGVNEDLRGPAWTSAKTVDDLATSLGSLAALPVNVDPSVFRLATTVGRWAAALMVHYRYPGDLANSSYAVVIGTVSGYQAKAIGWCATGPREKSVLMAVRVERMVKGTLNRELILLDLGLEEADRTVARYSKAAPPGTRLMVFLDRPIQWIPDVFPPKHPQSLVFEDVTAAGVGLVGGFTELSGRRWTTPKTLDELAAGFYRPSTGIADCRIYVRDAWESTDNDRRITVRPDGGFVCGREYRVTVDEARTRCPDALRRIEAAVPGTTVQETVLKNDLLNHVQFKCLISVVAR